MNIETRIYKEKCKLGGSALTPGEKAVAKILEEIIAENNRAINSLKYLMEGDCA